MIQILLFALLLGLALLIMSAPPQGGDRLPGRFVGETDVPERSPQGREGGPAREGRRVSVRRLGWAGVALLAAAGLVWRGWLWWSASVAGPDSVRLAVLPFETAGPQEPYVAVALTEELATRLVREGLSVASLSAVRALIADGRSDDVVGELGADYLVEGSVSVDGEGSEAQLLVRVRLVDARSATQVWSEAYDEPAARIFDVERRIAERVATAIDLPLASASESPVTDATTDDYRAYEAYLEGLSHRRRARDPEFAREARVMFARATAFDPEFAPGWAGLATSLVFLSNEHDYAVPVDSARILVDRASRLAPTDSDVVMADALIRWALELDVDGAIERYEQLEPHVSELRRPVIRGFLRDLYWVRGDTDAALEWGRAALEANPFMTTVFVGLARLLLRTGEIDAGVALLDRQVTGETDPRADRLRLMAPLISAGDTAAARRVLTEMDGARMSPLLHGLRPSSRALARVLGDDLDPAALVGPTADASRSTRAGARLARGLMLADRGDRLGAAADLEAAVAVFDEVLSTPELLAPHTRVRVESGRAVALAALGSSAEARAALAALERDLSDPDDRFMRETLLLSKAEVLARIGDPDGARQALDEAYALPALVSPNLASVDPLWAGLRSR